MMRQKCELAKGASHILSWNQEKNPVEAEKKVFS
jgi:hypothetical protein